ncbi:hypothetical protein Tdes44962_MAKER01233 [Teratosphaeria destructans]|uniref:Uncharacterized protein n=1 Tax=Teratosphaeria destructans TaxID=418781 RepID=A0A9W7W6P4_9PEZI|nr:hypothetical protein Tdes44962_MAKER01233 [Teratosphaeria destructans]
MDATVGARIVKLVTDSTSQGTTNESLGYATIATKVAELIDQARNTTTIQASGSTTSNTGRERSKTTFEFAGLPPELRNHIYSLTLPLPPGSRIDISRHAQWGPRMKAKKKKWQEDRANGITRRLRSCYLEATPVIKVPKKTQKTPDVAEYKDKRVPIHAVMSANLLLANRSINQEATAALYGGNRFSFQTPFAAADFMEWIGDQHHLLREVQVLQFRPGRDHKLLSPTLASLQRISRLSVHLEGSCHSAIHFSVIWHQLRDFIRAASCDCGAGTRTCPCVAAKRRARLDAIALGPAGIFVNRQDVVCANYLTEEFRDDDAVEMAQKMAGAKLEVTSDRRARLMKERLVRAFEEDESLRRMVQ